MNNKIKIIREKLNITQEKLAQICEISYSTIRNIENDRTNPSLEIAYKIANALKENIEKVFPNIKKD